MSLDLTRLVRDYGDPWGEAAECRRVAAHFDFSFMARAQVRGASALKALRHLTSRPLEDLAPGRIRYALREDQQGQFTSDLTIWRTGADIYELMSGRREDVEELSELAPSGTVKDLTDETAILAVQGPGSLGVLAHRADDRRLEGLAYFGFTEISIGGVAATAARIGYTGELGFELVVPRRCAEDIRADLTRRCRPAGFAAADILRIEAGFVLFANDFQLPVTAREAGLAAFSTHPAGDRAELALVAFRAEASERPVLWQPPRPPKGPRPGEIAVTSACWSPVAGGVLGLGYVRAAETAPGTELVDPAGTFGNVRVVERPYYDPDKRVPRGPWPRP